MEKRFTALNPIGRVVASNSRIAPRLKDLNMKRMGIIDNHKHNADIVLNILKDKLCSKYNFKEILYFQKKSAAQAADFIDSIAAKCDFILNGVGH